MKGCGAGGRDTRGKGHIVCKGGGDVIVMNLVAFVSSNSGK